MTYVKKKRKTRSKKKVIKKSSWNPISKIMSKFKRKKKPAFQNDKGRRMIHLKLKPVTCSTNDYYTPEGIWNLVYEKVLLKWRDKVVYEGFFGQGHTFNTLKNSYGFSNVIGKKDLDFFSTESEENYINKCDIVITNPAFTRKYDAMKLLVSLRKPFIFILPLHTINTIGFSKCFGVDEVEKEKITLIIPKGRLKFIRHNKIATAPSFETCFVCYDIDEPKLMWINDRQII